MDCSNRREAFGGAVGMSHLFLRRAVCEGDTVIDATCGNGHDTLFLARLVGNGGTVWAFDVQEEALAAAEKLLRAEGCLPWVHLVLAGHERMVEYVREPVRAVVFNLGFLPGREGGVVTRPETTLSALEQAAELLLPGGIIAIALYTGHPGGAEEAAAVEQWSARLPPRIFTAWQSRQLNRSHTAPYLVLIEKVR
jgi:ubiquinone/menaquinone biosynthesis C-methylase UbiE